MSGAGTPATTALGGVTAPARACSMVVTTDAPVDDQRLAVGAEHDVRGLEVAVDDAVAVGVGHCVAGRDQALQELAELQRVEPPRRAGSVSDRSIRGLTLRSLTDPLRGCPP